MGSGRNNSWQYTREASGASRYPIGDGQHGVQEERGGSVQKRLLGMAIQQKDNSVSNFNAISRTPKQIAKGYEKWHTGLRRPS